MEVNAGFECQLRAYAVANYDVYVAQQVLLRRRIRDLYLIREQMSSSNSSSNSANSGSTPLVSTDQAHPVPHHADSITSMSIIPVAPSIVNSSSISDLAHLEIDGPSEPSPDALRKMSALHKRTWRDAKHDGLNNIETKDGDSDNMMELDTSNDAIADAINEAASRISALPSHSSKNGTVRLGRHASIAGERIENPSRPFLTSNDTLADGSSLTRSSTFRRGGLSRGTRSNRRRETYCANSSNADVETKTPSCRLSKPGSSSVRVMPPLRGLEREFKCSWCNVNLFSLANVIRVDIDTLPLLDVFRAEEKAAAISAEERQQFQLYGVNSSSSSALSQAAKEALEGTDDGNGSNSILMRGMTPKVRRGSVNFFNPSAGFTGETGGMMTSVNSVSMESNLHTNDMDVDIPIDNDEEPVYGDFAAAEPKYVPALKSTRAGSSAKGFSFDMPTISTSSSSRSSSQYSGDLAVEKLTDSRRSSLSKGQPLDDRSLKNGSGSNDRGSNTRTSLSLNFCSDSKASAFNGVALAGAKGAGSKPLSPLSYVASSSHPFQHNTVSSRPSSATTTLYAGLQHGGNVGSSSSSSSGSIDDSPRVMIPPHRLNESGWSPVDRPQSAEKRRWLARVNLLREGDSKVAKMAEDDDKAAALAFGRDKYFYIEYMPWMGKEVFQSTSDIGEICCSDCRKTVGSWLWKPSPR